MLDLHCQPGSILQNPAGNLDRFAHRDVALNGGALVNRQGNTANIPGNDNFKIVIFSL